MPYVPKNMSWLGITAGIAGATVVGAVWYSPVVFGKMKASYLQAEREKNESERAPLGVKDAITAYLPTLAANTGVMLVLSHVTAKHVGFRNINDALHAGFGLSVVTCLLQIPHYSYSNRPWGLYFINRGYDMSILVLSSVLLYYIE